MNPQKKNASKKKRKKNLKKGEKKKNAELSRMHFVRYGATKNIKKSSGLLSFWEHSRQKTPK